MRALEEPAQREEVNRGYVSWLPRLTPGVVELILVGRHPDATPLQEPLGGRAGRGDCNGRKCVLS